MTLRQRAVVTLLFVAIASEFAGGVGADVVEDQRKIFEHEQSILKRKKREDEERRDTEQRAKTAVTRQKQATAIATQAALEAAATTLATNLTSPPPAQVVGVNPQFTILSGGRNAGVSRDDTVRCFARGQPIIYQGEQIGFDETPIGNGTVSEVREKVSLIQLNQPQATPKIDDVCYRSRVEFGKVALMPFLHKGQRTQLGETVAERLYQALTDRGVTLVERSQLARVIGEQQLGASGLLDERKAAHIGALVGADALLLGTIDASGTDVLLTLPVVGSRDGVILTSQQAKLPKNEFSLALLSQLPGTEPTVPTIPLAVLLQARKAVDRANVLIAAGQLQEASVAFAEAIELAPNTSEVQRLAKRLRAAPAKDAPGALAKAEAFLTAGMLPDAAEAFVEGVRLNPNLTNVEVVARRIRAATEGCDRQIRDAFVRDRKATAKELMRTGDYEGADRTLAVGVALAPNDPESAFLAADMSHRQVTVHLSEFVLQLFQALP